MLRGVLLKLGFVLAVSWTAAVPAASVAVKDVRVWADAEGTRVVLDLSAPVKHSLQTLDDPARVVIDLPNARLERPDSSLPAQRGFVRQLRSSQQPGGELRIVIDLSSPARPKSFTVAPSGAYGDRLVVDLAPASGANAAASAVAARASASAPAAPPAPPQVVKSAGDAHGREVVVAIDAGHGGEDPGSIGKKGTYEKHVTLAIARRLHERINREPGMRAVLTRDGDFFVPLRDRMVRARRQNADMFVSIHADSFRDRTVAGSSVYVLSARGATDEAARWLAEKENASDLIGGVTLDDKDDALKSVLLDLSQGASMSASISAAEMVLEELNRVGNVRRPAVQHAGFLVLKSPDIPSMLVETAFISNPGEEAKLINPRHQQRLAEAIHQGVRSYFYNNPPPGTRFAELRSRGSAPMTASTAGEPASGVSN